MEDNSDWLLTAAFAELVDLTPQAAGKALRLAMAGQTWRGNALTVRQSIGRGGRAGLVYEVWIHSLPPEIRPTTEVGASLAPTTALRRSASRQGEVIAKRWQAIQGALIHPRQSAERGQTLKAIAERTGQSVRTLYRWIDQYESQGVRGLARARPSNAGQARVVVSRVFDRAARSAGQTEDDLSAIAADLKKSIKGLWASRAESAGLNEIRRLAEFLLLQACERRNLSVERAAIRLSRRAVERFAHYRVVNQRRNDRKAFDDAKPRIRRDWTGLAPMERIVADVKHLDVIVRREDGTPAWPKIIGFFDAGTGRIFVHPVLLERGEGVRQEHVIEAFLAMVADPQWGFPQGLYLDNGSEFGALTKIEGALQLMNESGARTLIFARPYNASAKPIESLFARLDRYVFSMMPGYAGANRMAKKTQSVGKPPAPYPGSWAEFCATLQGLLAAHHNRPVGGQWRDRSPNDWFGDKVAGGWRTSQVDALSLDAAFADHDSRRIDRGVVRVGGVRYSHPALCALPSRTVVDLAMPWRRGGPPLCRTPQGWVYLEPESPYPARWVEGAKESTRRQRAQGRHVAKLAREAGRVDPVAVKLAWGAQFEAVLPSSTHGRLDLGEEARDKGLAIRRAEVERAAAPSKAEAIRAREMELTERLERKLRDDR